ncbi:hypothetical protein, partial [Streptomyces bobili]|uniref:hypothetical protein n=1 Tax=Streptomyces bobili TaxID=67280 RepID=UPI0037FA485B
MEFWDESIGEDWYQIYRRNTSGGWDHVTNVTSHSKDSTNELYSWVDTYQGFKGQGQCYMVTAVNGTTFKYGQSDEVCGVRLAGLPLNTSNEDSTGRVDQWNALPNHQGENGGLRNTDEWKYLQYESRDYGINLGYRDDGSRWLGWTVEAQGGPNIVYGQAVALKNQTGGYLTYGTRGQSSTVQLVWSSTPKYEWHVITGGAHAFGLPLSQDSGGYGLWNTAKNDWLISGHQEYGVNLKWKNGNSPVPNPYPTPTPQPGTKSVSTWNCQTEKHAVR